jgi:hypothetical protein
MLRHLPILLLTLALTSCAQQYYGPGNVVPIELTARGEGMASVNFGMIGPFPARSVDAQLGYSPVEGIGIVASGSYYHPLFDGERRLWGDIGVGKYGRLSKFIDWQVYGFAGRLHNYYRPDYRGIGEPVGERLIGAADLQFTRYMLWPSLRLRDRAGMSIALGLRLNRLGLTNAELTGPLSAFQVDRIRELGQQTPYHFAEVTGSFILSRSERNRLVLTLVRTSYTLDPVYFPTGMYHLYIGYSFRFGQPRSPRIKRLR